MPPNGRCTSAPVVPAFTYVIPVWRSRIALERRVDVTGEDRGREPVADAVCGADRILERGAPGSATSSGRRSPPARSASAGRRRRRPSAGSRSPRRVDASSPPVRRVAPSSLPISVYEWIFSTCGLVDDRADVRVVLPRAADLHPLRALDEPRLELARRRSHGRSRARRPCSAGPRCRRPTRRSGRPRGRDRRRPSR